MEPLHHILVVLEPLKGHQPALDRARELARRAATKLEVYCVDFNPALTGEPHVDSTVLADVRDAHTREFLSWLDSIREELVAEGLDATTASSYGRPYYEHVLQHVRDKPPDLLVKGARFHALLERNYFAASDWRLIAGCPVPLLLVKSTQLPANGPVVAAIDPFHSDDKPAQLDRRILEMGTAIAASLGRRLLVVHAVPPIAALPVVGEAHLRRIRAETERMNQHLEAVQELVRPFGVSRDSLHVMSGAAEHVIAGAAKEHQAGIVVMGAVSRSSVKELFIGNTAERVLEDVESDLLVVPMQPRQTA